MTYELWEIVHDEYGCYPLLLIEKNKNYSKIYQSFIKHIKEKNCVIHINLETK